MRFDHRLQRRRRPLNLVDLFQLGLFGVDCAADLGVLADFLFQPFGELGKRAGNRRFQLADRADDAVARQGVGDRYRIGHRLGCGPLLGLGVGKFSFGDSLFRFGNKFSYGLARRSSLGCRSFCHFGHLRGKVFDGRAMTKRLQVD